MQRYVERLTVRIDPFFLITVIAVLLSISAWFISYTNNLTVIYNDAMSHLDLARLVVDNIEPGMSQMGGVWLPLNHILSLGLIWNDWAWHSGFAASLVSMISYVLSVLLIYKSVEQVTKNLYASVIAALAFAFNLNILYLQTTPLTEPLYLVSFCASVFAFVNWIKTQQPKYLLLLGFFGLLQVLSRYDGWFVVLVEGGLLLLEQYAKRRPLSEVVGKLIIFLFPVFFGIAFWVGWNLLIFNDPLFFILGPYSAHAQQQTIAARSILITKGDFLFSLYAYGYTVVDNIGGILMICAVIGASYFMVTRVRSIAFLEKSLILIFLLAPIIFNIIALYFGFSILNVPELHWKPSNDPASQWFNVRYGILALPFVAFSIGFFATSRRWIAVVLFFLIFLQFYMTGNQGIITVTDGLKGSSSFVNQDVASYLNKSVKPGDRVLMSTSFFNAVAFKSGLDLSQVIHEGVSKVWPLAVEDPELYAPWVVMAKGDVGDPVYTTLVKNQKDRFLSAYELAYSGNYANVYELKPEDQIFITRNGSDLRLGNHVYNVHGVNSYDLAYQGDDQIKQSLKDLKAIGVNTVRFWMFGDGDIDGFQPKAGVINNKELAKVDLILEEAKKDNMKVIPVFINNWSDYGGKVQYLKWVGDDNINDPDAFYRDPNTTDLYKNYINHMVTHQNTLTGVAYKDDPTILGWDLMNEPRVGAMGNVGLANWIKNTGTYLKTIDTNHLVMIGTERTNNDICGLEVIDVCSVHFYTDQDDTVSLAAFSGVQALLKNQSLISKDLGKPIILGEFGISKYESPYQQPPLQTMLGIIKETVADNYNGVMVWNWSLNSDDSYGFSVNGNKEGLYTKTDLSHILMTANGK